MRKSLVLVFAGLMVLLLAGSVSAATIAYTLDGDGVIFSDPGPEFINTYNATVNMTIVTVNGTPFTLSSYSGTAVDTLSVTAKFVDEYGNAIDVTGDGAADTFTATEESEGVWVATMNTNAQPGEYTLYLHAKAYNATTGEIVDEGNVTVDVYIADEYWVTHWATEGEKFKVANFEVKLEDINERGALLIFNDQLNTITPDSNGVMVTQVDLDNDGSATDWMFVESTDSGMAVVKFFSKNDILQEEPEDKVTVKGDTVRRSAWLKNWNSYRQVVLWDKSPFAWIKAEDYYIIPAKGRSNWREGWGSGYSGKITIVKRTTYFNLLSRDEEVFKGNMFGRTVGDDVLKVIGSWAGNKAWYGFWEVAQGIATMTYPKDYEIRYRNAAVVSDLPFRGKIHLPGFGSKSVNWDILLVSNETAS